MAINLKYTQDNLGIYDSAMPAYTIKGASKGDSYIRDNVKRLEDYELEALRLVLIGHIAKYKVLYQDSHEEESRALKIVEQEILERQLLKE